MKVLVACEFSGIVRDAFIYMGCDAISCDFLESERIGPHIQDDVLLHLDEKWDLMIAHPPCTHLAVSGARWFKYKQKEQQEALNFVKTLLNAPIEYIAIENPTPLKVVELPKHSQAIQPYEYGHEYSKRTLLWLKNLLQMLYKPIHTKR